MASNAVAPITTPTIAPTFTEFDEKETRAVEVGRCNMSDDEVWAALRIGLSEMVEF